MTFPIPLTKKNGNHLDCRSFSDCLALLALFLVLNAVVLGTISPHFPFALKSVVSFSVDMCVEHSDIGKPAANHNLCSALCSDIGLLSVVSVKCKEDCSVLSVCDFHKSISFSL